MKILATDLYKICARCGLNRPHGPNTRKKGGHQTICRECSSYYATWWQMVSRCTDPTHPKWKDYGGRGITVCMRWLDFSNFREDMGPRPPGLQLDRIDNNKGYYKENCRWATRNQQCQNMRSNKIVTIDGQDMVMSEVARQNGLRKQVIRYRAEHGKTGDELVAPVKVNRKPLTQQERNMVTAMVMSGVPSREIAAAVGAHPVSVSRWIRQWGISRPNPA